MPRDDLLHNPVQKKKELRALDLILQVRCFFHFSIDKIADKHK